jgi:hypothetical protein
MSWYSAHQHQRGTTTSSTAPGTKFGGSRDQPPGATVRGAFTKEKAPLGFKPASTRSAGRLLSLYTRSCDVSRKNHPLRFPRGVQQNYSRHASKHTFDNWVVPTATWPNDSLFWSNRRAVCVIVVWISSANASFRVTGTSPTEAHGH